ncbi:hypothetical protein [Fodinicola feengrottensis]|uniref:Uncharacterized protein n=1 Tax=Fodinicola feengrottensis TaxID=435914 RepID=A0ABN2GHE5_9ACTN|nr:hypothetical protein [Fodinicola feengrottensis]
MDQTTATTTGTATTAAPATIIQVTSLFGLATGAPLARRAPYRADLIERFGAR